MSANYEQRKLIEALDSGADDFIGKPPAVEELYARLRAAERLGAMQRELVRLATTDPLSGLLNRRAFFERAQEACASAGDSKSAVISAIMFDIDYFKRINDDFGHGTGDDVIRAVANEAICEKGIVGRLGGEEFAIFAAGLSRMRPKQRSACSRSPNFASRRWASRSDFAASALAIGGTAGIDDLLKSVTWHSIAPRKPAKPRRCR